MARKNYDTKRTWSYAPPKPRYVMAQGNNVFTRPLKPTANLKLMLGDKVNLSSIRDRRVAVSFLGFELEDWLAAESEVLRTMDKKN
jgi:hypothetical protein